MDLNELKKAENTQGDFYIYFHYNIKKNHNYENNSIKESEKYKKYVIYCMEKLFIDKELTNYINGLFSKRLVKPSIEEFKKNTYEYYINYIKKIQINIKNIYGSLTNIDILFKKFIRETCENYNTLKFLNNKMKYKFSEIIPKIFINLLKSNPYYYNYYFIYIKNNCKNIYSNHEKKLKPINNPLSINKLSVINHNNRSAEQIHNRNLSSEGKALKVLGIRQKTPNNKQIMNRGIEESKSPETEEAIRQAETEEAIRQAKAKAEAETEEAIIQAKAEAEAKAKSETEEAIIQAKAEAEAIRQAETEDAIRQDKATNSIIINKEKELLDYISLITKNNTNNKIKKELKVQINKYKRINKNFELEINEFSIKNLQNLRLNINKIIEFIKGKRNAYYIQNLTQKQKENRRDRHQKSLDDLDKIIIIINDLIKMINNRHLIIKIRKEAEARQARIKAKEAEEAERKAMEAENKRKAEIQRKAMETKNKNKKINEEITQQKLNELYNLPISKVRELIRNETSKLLNTSINVSNFKNNDYTNPKRLIKLINIFIINNKFLKDKTKFRRNMGVLYQSYTQSNTNKKSINFDKEELDKIIINLNILKKETSSYIAVERSKKSQSVSSSAIKRHNINILILNFLLKILNNYKKRNNNN